MIDTHSHLFSSEFNNDLADCILRAKNNHVSKIILVGFSRKTNEEAYNLSLKYDIFYPTAGVHPSEACENIEKNLYDLEEFIKNHKVYAIGECGLDYYWVKDNKEEQKKLFKGQCELAVKYNLPIIIHARDAIEDTFNILCEYRGKIKGVMHCYSGSYEMALRFIDLGFYISLGGPVTFKNAKEPKRVAKLIPLDRLLIETDCPYLAPTPYRGGRNESSYVKNVLEEIANIRGLDINELDKITETNSISLFKLE